METYPNWIRLHPDSMDETLVKSVQARIHDPLWMLGRQWQFGELRHDGGATPIGVRIEGTSAVLARMRSGRDAATPSVALDVRSVPLEALIEREAVEESGFEGLRLRSEAGVQLLRMLRAADLTAEADAWTTRCPFVLPAGAQIDEETLAWWDLVGGRVPDSAKLHSTIREALAETAVPAISAAEATVLQAWLTWHAGRFQTPGGAETWDPERMEYSFITAGFGVGNREVVLPAPEYVDGRLEWYDFEESSGNLGAPATAPTPRTFFRIPAPLAFAGMPNPRFWTFEDPSVRFDALELLSRPDAQPSPATLMVLDFALSYSDDWFLIPLALDPWTIFQTTAVVITDVFGDATTANHPGGRWNLFRLQSNRNRFGLAMLFLVAAPAETTEGPPLEEVHFLRDEVANVAWAVERVVPTSLTRGIEPPRPDPVPASPPKSGLVWTLAPPSPPRNWFPLLPTGVARLELGALWSAPDVLPAGTLLAELGAGHRKLHQEEVPIEGVQVSRRWQSARGIDGSLHFWIGRIKTPRRDETAPMIQFDLVQWK